MILTFLRLLIVAFLLICGNALAAKSDRQVGEVTWRFSHFLPATHSLAKAMSEWAQNLQQATDGKLNIVVFPASQLGSGLDHYDMVRTRVAHLAWIVPGYEQGRFPIFSLLETPFLISNAVSGARAFHQWYTRYADLEMESVMPCLLTTSPPGRLNFKQQRVDTPEGIRGKRMRVANATVARYMRSLGGVTVNIPLSEARHALERGMIDGMPFGAYSIKTMSLDSALLSHLDLPFSSSPAVVGINRRSLAELPDALRSKVMDYCDAEWSGRVVQDWQQLEMQAMATFREDPEREVYAIGKEQVKNWVNRAEPLIAEWKLLSSRRGLQNPENALEHLYTVLRTNAAGFSSRNGKKSAEAVK